MFHAAVPDAQRFLQSQPWFARTSDELRSRVLEHSFTLRGAKGETLLPAGMPVDGWYAVLTGLVKLQSVPKQGRRSAFLGVPAGDWFGEGSALRPEPRRYEVVALRDSELLCLPRAEFLALHARCLAFNESLAAHLNRHLGQAMAIIEAGRLRTPEQRVALYLSPLFWPGRRRLPLTQDELGQLAGLSRQTVNRALRSLEQRGLVSLALGEVHLPDGEALAQFLAEAAD